MLKLRPFLQPLPGAAHRLHSASDPQASSDSHGSAALVPQRLGTAGLEATLTGVQTSLELWLLLRKYTSLFPIGSRFSQFVP